MSSNRTQVMALAAVAVVAVAGLAALFLAGDPVEPDVPRPHAGGGSEVAQPGDRPGDPATPDPRPVTGPGAGDADQPPPPTPGDRPGPEPTPTPVAVGGTRPDGSSAATDGPVALEVRCLDAAGQPLPGVRIEARRASGAPLEAAISGPDGRARVSGLAPGEAVSGAGRHALTQGAVPFGPVRAGGEVVLRFSASERGRIEGRIVDEQGSPVTRAELHLIEAGKGNSPAVLDATAIGLGPDGWFTATVAAGQYAVEAVGPGLSPSDQAYVTVEANATAGPFTFVTTRQGLLAGRVELPPDLGAAFPVELDVLLEVKGGTAANPYTRTARRPIQVGVDGVFELTGCDAGAYRARVELPAAGRHRVGPWASFTLDPGQQKVDLVLRFAEVSVSLAGTVRDDAGRPVPNAEVTANSRSTRTDDAGHYEFRGLDFGDLGVGATCEGYARAYQQTAFDGSLVELDLVLTRTGGVRGQVLSGGQPAARVPVLVIARGDDDTYEPHQTRTDASGAYRLEELPAGRYYLKAGPGADPFDVDGAPSVEVTPGAVVEAAPITLH